MRWSDNNLSRSQSQEDLDRLLEGLEQLTLTLPDLGNKEKTTTTTTTTTKRTRGEGASPPATPVAGSAASTLKHHEAPRSILQRRTEEPFSVNTLEDKEIPPPRPVLPQALLRSPITRQDGIDGGEKGKEEEEVVFPSVKRTRQLLQSRDTYNADGISYSDYHEIGGAGGRGRPGHASSSIGPVKQPYHTLKNSKPFSYIRTTENMARIGAAVRNATRSSSREEEDDPSGAGMGLQSPGLLKKIMAGRETNVDRDDLAAKSHDGSFADTGGRPLYSSTPKVSREENYSSSSHIYNHSSSYGVQKASPQQQQQQPQQPHQPHQPFSPSPSPLLDNHLSDFEASLSWLEKQQRKLHGRREVQRRRENRGQQEVLNELKSSMRQADVQQEQQQQQQQQQQHYQARSETTTDGYASDLASMLYSETSTRESSPHKTTFLNTSTQTHQQEQQQQQHYKTTINIPVRADPTYQYEQQQHAQQQYQQQYGAIGNGTETSHHQSYYSTSRSAHSNYDRSSGSGRFRQQHRHADLYGASGGGYASDYGICYGSTSLSSRHQRGRGPWPRPRYDSESESDLLAVSDLFGRTSAFGSSTSVDSAMQWGAGGGYGSQPGSRPITPAFPTIPSTPVFNLRSKSSSSLQHRVRSSSANNLRLVKDSYRLWYRPDITREEAIAALRHAHPGTFVVRDSNSFPGAFGLALKVAVPPVAANGNSSSSESDLVRHFLIEPTSKGVRLKGYVNEPVFASLSALVYQHTLTQLALPERLMLPRTDADGKGGDDSNNARRGSTDSAAIQMHQLLSQGAACNVTYLLTLETDALTGPMAVRKATNHLFRRSRQPRPLLVHFKVTKYVPVVVCSGKRKFSKDFSTYQLSN